MRVFLATLYLSTPLQDGTPPIQNELNDEINRLTKQIAEKDMELDKKEQALEQTKWEERSLTQELADIKEKKKEAKERTNELMLEKARLETTLQLKEQEIESLKQSAGKESAQVKEMIAMKEREYEDIKKELETLERELDSERKKVSHLRVEKELQEKLDQRGIEIQFLKKSFQEKEECLKQIIAMKEQEVLEHKKELKKVEKELESKKKETTHLQARFQNITVELEGKTVLARQLQQTKDETCSQLKEERERMDKYVRSSMTTQASTESHVMKTNVMNAEVSLK